MDKDLKGSTNQLQKRKKADVSTSVLIDFSLILLKIYESEYNHKDRDWIVWVVRGQ